MYTDIEIKQLSTHSLKEELRKTQQTLLYFEMADNPQYYQSREVEERTKTKQYHFILFNELKQREEHIC